MRQTDKDESAPALGKPIRTEPKPLPAPAWRPVQSSPNHETNGTDVRLKPGKA